MLATRHSFNACCGPKTIQRGLPPPTWHAARNSWAGSGRPAVRLPCAAPGNNGNSSGSGMPSARVEDQEPSLVHKGSGPGSMVAQSEAIAAPLLSQCLDDDKELFVTTQGVVVDRVDEQTAEFDYLGETTEGNLHLVERLKRAGVVGGILGLSSLEDIYSVDPKKLRAATQEVLNELEVPPQYPGGNPERGVYCSRTLNLRSIKAIGFDMDYTCISYDVNAWEGRAYEYGMDSLRAQGVPVEGLRFDPDMVIRGLIMDKDKGNLIKVDRFGCVAGNGICKQGQC